MNKMIKQAILYLVAVVPFYLYVLFTTQKIGEGFNILALVFNIYTFAVILIGSYISSFFIDETKSKFSYNLLLALLLLPFTITWFMINGFNTIVEYVGMILFYLILVLLSSAIGVSLEIFTTWIIRTIQRFPPAMK